MNRDSRENLIVWAALCGFIVYLTLGVMHHEAWRDEWQAINIARAATSLPDLYARLRYEWHPPVWYLSVRAVWTIFPALTAVQLFNGVCAATAAGLVAFLAPWPLWLRLMVAFTGPAAWEYSVKARSYGLGWLIVVALALYLRRPADQRKGWVLAFLAILALNVSVFSGMIAFSLGAAWLWEEYRAKRLRQTLAPVAALAAATVATFLLMLPAADAAGLTPRGASFADGIIILGRFCASLLPDLVQEDAHPAVLLTVAALLIFSFFRFVCANAAARVALACGWLSLTTFLLLTKLACPWHLWHLFLAPFAAAIAFEQRRVLPPSALAVLAALAAVGLNCGVREYIHDWKTTYSGAKPAARAMVRDGITAPVVVYPAYYTSSLSGYLGRPVHDITCSGESSYVVWRAIAFSKDYSFACAVRLARANPARQSVVTLPDPLQKAELDKLAAYPDIRLSFIGAYPGDEEGRFAPKESFYLYRLTSAPLLTGTQP